MMIETNEKQIKYKPDGVTEENIMQQLITEFEKAIRLIYDMSIYCNKKIATPWDTVRRWDNLIKYAEKETMTNGGIKP